MSSMIIRKAERKKAKLRLGIAAPSGGGKTYGALQLAFGLGGKVGMIDTEHGSGDLYAHLGEYDIISIEAPYEISKYLSAIKAFEQAGYSTIIIDSLSHAWAGEGGLLDKQGKLADKSGNGYTAWRNVTPEHNQLVEALLKSPCHIIATMRSKVEYVVEANEKGKSAPRKIGLAPVQRDGMEYEFTVFMEVNNQHVATTTKDRTSMLDGRVFQLDVALGKQLLAWLEDGVDMLAASIDKLNKADTFDGLKAEFANAYRQLTPSEQIGLKAVYDARKAELEPLQAGATAIEPEQSQPNQGEAA